MNKQTIKTDLVNSSNIKALGYDAATRTMQVDFWIGSKYQYNPITLEAFHELKNAESIGAHFNRHIKDNKLIDFICIQEKPVRK